jgi:hypothetical protein
MDETRFPRVSEERNRKLLEVLLAADTSCRILGATGTKLVVAEVPNFMT